MNADTAKTLVRHYFHRLLNEKDVSICDELPAAEYIDHDAPPHTPTGPSSTKAFVAMFIEEYPDLQVQIADILAEENKVAARIIWRGTHRHSGVSLHQIGIVMLQLNEQRQFVERWSGYSTLAQ